MKLCPLCRQCYEDKFTSCVHDRTTLTGSRPGPCLVAQKYRLDRLLTTSGAQAVYAGRHLETDRPYAINLFLLDVSAGEEAIKSFRREALAMAHLNTRFDHQHAAKTYDYGLLPDGTVYVITEQIAGQSLRRYMDEAAPLPVVTAVRIARQVAAGLEAAHRCGVAHQGLEPANIILMRDYYQQLEVKIIDFGFASLLKQRAEANGRDAHNPGQPDAPLSPYVAPEQRMGQPTDARSDIYSLGVILYEMLAGRLPFGAEEPISAGQDNEAVHLPLAWLSFAMPEPLALLLTQQLQSRPGARPLSAASVAQRLRAVENSLAPVHTPAPAEDDHAEDAQASAACEPTVPIPVQASDRLPASGIGIQPTAPPTAALHARTHELETDDTLFAADDDSILPQEESGRISGGITVAAQSPEKLAAQARRPLRLSPMLLSSLSFGARSANGARQPKAADVLRRARPLYVAFAAALILGLVGGLWVANQHASESRQPTPRSSSEAEAVGQSKQGTFTQTSSVVGDGDSLASDVRSTPAGTDKPTPAATPGASDELKARRAPSLDEASGTKEVGENPLAATIEQRRGKAAIGEYESAGRQPEQRQGGGDGPCKLLVSARALSIRAGGGSDTITVSSQSVNGPATVTATTKNWPDIAVFPESRGDRGGPVKYSIVSVSKRGGAFAVSFKSPCGMKTVPVIVQ